MTTSRRKLLVSMAAGVWAAGAARTARATQAVPLRSIQLHVPVPPGTQPDQIARWLAEPIQRRSGLPVVVHNRPGAGGAIAADAVLAADTESGALLLGGLDHVVYAPRGGNRRALDPFIDFVPIGAVNRDTWLVVTSAEAGPQRLDGLREAARAPLTYASQGELSTSHLLAARLSRAIGVEAQHLAYRDSLLPDLVAGRIAFAVLPTPTALAQVRGGRLRALATLSAERLSVLPDVPTMAELGHPGQVFRGGLFLFAPAALGGHAARLNGWLADAQREPEVAARYVAAAIEPAPLDLEQTRQAVVERLRVVSAMREEVFGRTRGG
jgi:tripartite-type tricarboxylate transporter receptor subunit TctC